LLAGAIGVGTGVARADEPTASQLMQQIEQLQAKVQQLEARQTAAATQDTTTATVERVIQDANSRSQFLQSEGFTAGWTKDKGFRIQDAQGNWVLHPMALFQFRNVTSYLHSSAVVDSDGDIVGFDNEDSFENGFEVSNLKLGFDGSAISPDLTYYFLWNTGTSGGSVGLEQAWVQYMFNDDWGIRAGQFTNPVFHEQTIDSGRQLAVDRSMTNFLATGVNEAFTQGISFIYAPAGAQYNAMFGFGDGFNTGNTDFSDDGSGANYNVFGRVNYFVKGTPKAYDDFTARGNRDDLLVIGGGLDQTDQDSANITRYTVDAQWENTGGVSLYLAYLGAHVEPHDGGDSGHNYGALGQAGYMLNEDWEAFGRLGYFKADAENTFGEDAWCEVTVGANWYWMDHHAKFTIDLTYLSNGLPVGSEDLNMLASDDAGAIVRAQLQLML
jgi:hypothetical protein